MVSVSDLDFVYICFTCVLCVLSCGRWWLPQGVGAVGPSETHSIHHPQGGAEAVNPPAAEKPAVVLVAKCPAALLQPTKPVVHR